MLRLQNHIPNMTKSQYAYLEKDLVLTLDHLMILMFCFVRKTGKNLQKQQMVLPVTSNLFQPLFSSTPVSTSMTSGLLPFGILYQIKIYM